MSIPEQNTSPLKLDSLATLVLNSDFSPIQVIDWRPAIEDIVSGSAYSYRDHPDAVVRSEKRNFPVPSILVRRRYINHYRPAAFTRRNVLLAYWQPDPTNRGLHWICALCGEPMRLSDLTFDHLIPRCRGGQTSWENIVLADPCCNNRKGHKTLGQAGMRLYVSPRRPTEAELGVTRIQSRLASGNPSFDGWDDFIGSGYWDVPLER